MNYIVHCTALNCTQLHCPASRGSAQICSEHPPLKCLTKWWSHKRNIPISTLLGCLLVGYWYDMMQMPNFDLARTPRKHPKEHGEGHRSQDHHQGQGQRQGRQGDFEYLLPNIAHCTSHTVHCTLQTKHFTLDTAICTLHTAHQNHHLTQNFWNYSEFCLFGKMTQKWLRNSACKGKNITQNFALFVHTSSCTGGPEGRAAPAWGGRAPPRLRDGSGRRVGDQGCQQDQERYQTGALDGRWRAVQHSSLALVQQSPAECNKVHSHILNY